MAAYWKWEARKRRFEKKQAEEKEIPTQKGSTSEVFLLSCM